MERDPPKGVPPDDERYLMTLRIPKKSTVQGFRMIGWLGVAVLKTSNIINYGQGWGFTRAWVFQDPQN